MKIYFYNNHFNYETYLFSLEGSTNGDLLFGGTKAYFSIDKGIPIVSSKDDLHSVIGEVQKHFTLLCGGTLETEVSSLSSSITSSEPKTIAYSAVVGWSDLFSILSVEKL